jgi:hypothetical protein
MEQERKTEVVMRRSKHLTIVIKIGVLRVSKLTNVIAKKNKRIELHCR